MKLLLPLLALCCVTFVDAQAHLINKLKDEAEEAGDKQAEAKTKTDDSDELIKTSKTKSYSFCADVSAGLTVKFADLDLNFGGSAKVQFTEGPDKSNAVSLNGMIGVGLSAGAVALKGSYNLKGALQVKGILPPSIKSTQYIKAIKWTLLRWLEIQKVQTPVGRVLEYLQNTKSVNKIEGVMKTVRKRMKQEQGTTLHEKFMHREIVDDADKKYKEFIIAFRHRASNILKKIKKASLYMKEHDTEVFKVYVEEFWQIWSQIYMNNEVEALTSTKKATLFSPKKKIKCSNGMFGKKPSGIQQLFCTWMKYGFMIPGKERDEKGVETENIMQSFGLVYPELFPGYECTDVSEEGGGCNRKVDAGKLKKILEQVDLPELFLEHTKSPDFSIHKKVSKMISKNLDHHSVHSEIVAYVTKKRKKMKFTNDEITTDAKEKLDQLLVLFQDQALEMLEKISPGTDPELALQIYQQEFSDIWGEIYLNDHKVLKGKSKNIECSKVPNVTPFQQLFCTFLKNGYWIPGLAMGRNEKQNVIQSLGFVYPELFPGYSCEPGTTTCQINVDKLRAYLLAVSNQDERDEWADVGDEDAEDFAVTGITHDLLPVHPDDFEEMWTQLFNQSQYNDGECLTEGTCGITSITFTGKRNLQLGTNGGICGNVGTGIDVTRALPRVCKIHPAGDGLECQAREKIGTVVTVRAGGFFLTNLGWTGNLFDAPKDNGLRLKIGIRAPGIQILNILGDIAEDNACDVLFKTADVAHFVKRIVQDQHQDQKTEQTGLVSKIKSSREKMRRFQKSLEKIFKQTGGVVGDIIKAAAKTTVAVFFDRLLGRALKAVSPIAAHFTTKWVFGFDVDINFAKKGVDFSFVFANKHDNTVSGNVGMVQLAAGVHLERNTVCKVQLGPFLKDIFSNNRKDEL